jgi:hypothetical protein
MNEINKEHKGKKELKGIGGWLLVFTILLTIMVLDSLYGVFAFGDIYSFIVLFVGGWLLFLIYLKQKLFIKASYYALNVLIAYSVYTSTGEVLNLINVWKSLDGVTLSFKIGLIFGGIMFIVTIYLFRRYIEKSKRVKNTFIY